MPLRIGADVGGTFTDVVLERDDGRFVSTKVLTTGRPEEGVLAAVTELAAGNDVDLAEVTQIIHGTTLATNALIQRTGASTALVTTAGFRDVIETRTESRFEQYDLNIVLPAPLIERKDRYVVSERLNARGETLVPFDESGARAVVAELVDGDYESVAVGFMHSYRNGGHERRFRELLREAAPGVAISLSSEVSPRMREYERFNTACANAYVQPQMASYLRRLEAELHRLGTTCPLHLIHSGGGLLSVEVAAAFPVRLVESGPAGGAVFAADLAARHGRRRICSFDMGGTTAKIALIEDHAPRTASTFEVAREARFKKGSGMPISIPVIEMLEIGAGGGSIASVDALGQIRVGPRSAGSEPGPAAYDLGGDDPTVTDADVCLGRLHPDTFGAKDISLSPERAVGAMQAIATPLGLDTVTGAVGVTEVVDENMANAARVHAVEGGKDLSGFSLVAFGGGAPVHATRLMDKLGLTEVLVPPGAGVGSAIGFLLAPFSYEAARSFYTTVEDFDGEGVNDTLAQLSAEAEAFVRRGTDAQVDVQRQASMRYRGQGWEIPVALPPGEVTAQALGGAFTAAYETHFGSAIDDLTIEAVSWSVRVASRRAPPEPVRPVIGGTAVTPGADRPVHDPATGERRDAGIVERAALVPGEQVQGPALIVEEQTTTVLGTHHAAVVAADGTLVIRSEASARSRAVLGDPAAAEPTTAPASPSRRGERGEVPLSAATCSAPASPCRRGERGEVQLQVMWNRLISIVEEQARTLVRTAFATSVREAGDLSAGVFDRHGRMIAQAVTGTPGHVNTMAAAVAHFITDIGPETIAPGDVYITNDPWKGTGHLHDFTVTTPVFVGDDLVGFFASTAHVVDVGGRGWGPDAREVYEEGLRIPIMRWADEGRLNRDLINIVRHNVRAADYVIGDLHGLAACNEIGRRRLGDMFDEFGISDLDEVAGFVFDRTRQATLDALAAVPPGTYRNEMRVDGYGEPVDLTVTLTVTPDGMHADFTGTSPLSPRGINVPITYAQAYFTYGMLVALAPELPNNHASLLPFTVSAPPGVILNATEPAPIAVRHVIGHFVTDLCLGALSQALPGVVPAEGSGAIWNFQASARTADPTAPLPPAEILMFNSGGTGARPTLDGLTATAFPSGVMTMSAEATEQVGPIVVWRKEIRAGSGGAGRRRGGLGQIMEIGPTDGYLFEFSAMFDRVDNPARGRAGGADGAPGRVYLDDGTPFATKGRHTVPAGRRLVLELPGGGGFGDPAERDPAAAANDRRQGYVL
ncbi:MAG: hydantoinase B/oxoprolinase family protein [bacterium]|nr:hydantoinase B/oxoprolinase family protein [bacterium]